MGKINIVIADDHSLVRQGIKQVIEFESDIEVVGEASNGEEAVKIISQFIPDIVLLDINMPILNGIQVIQRLKELNINSKIIMLTIHNDKDYLMKAVQLGAMGYVLKDADTSVLLEAIKNVYNNQKYIPSDLAAELIKGYGSNSNKGQENYLTEREIEVIRTIADGMSNKEIASALFISEKTVKNHISNIFKKLDINDRTQAAIFAIKHGIK